MAWAGVIRLALTMMVAVSSAYGGFQLADEMCQNARRKHEVLQYETIQRQEEILRQSLPRSASELFKRMHQHAE